MPAAAVVTIILAVVVVLVLAGFLLTIARVLVQVDRRLGAVIDAVSSIASQTKPVDSVVKSINGNLATARDVLSSLLESKVGVDGAAQLVASVDPLAQESGTPRHSFAGQDEPADDASPHSFARVEDQDELGRGLPGDEPSPPTFEDEPSPPTFEDEPADDTSVHSFARADQDEPADDESPHSFARAAEPPWGGHPEGEPPNAPDGDEAVPDAAEPESPDPAAARRPFPGGGGGGIQFHHDPEE